MAKQVMPPAVLEAYGDDVPAPASLLRHISLFKQLRSPPNLEKFPGSVRLRHYSAGEIICEHGDAGWSAFYTLTQDDVRFLRDHPAQRQPQAAEEYEKKKKQLKQNLANQAILVKQLTQPNANVAGLKKKIAAVERNVAKLENEIDNLGHEIAELDRAATALRALRALERGATRDETRERTKAALTQLCQQAKGRADKSRAAFVQEFLSAGAEKKRMSADSLENTDPELARLLRESAWADDGSERLAVIQLPRTRQQGQRKSWLSTVGGWFSSRADADVAPEFIRNDGPRDISSKSRIASLYEGELFGEFSCIYNTPRSATIVAAQECYVVEMLRNVLDAVKRDTVYRQRVEEKLRERMVESALRQFSIFSSLTNQQLVWLFNKVEFIQYDPGTLICDEHEESDCMYIIGGGTVKILKNTSWLIPPGASLDWKTLREELRRCAQAEGTVEKHIWTRLTEEIPTVLDQGVSNGKEQSKQRARLVHALNRLIKDPLLHQTDLFRGTMRQQNIGGKTWKHLAQTRKNSVEDMRRCNRMLLENLYGTAFPVWDSATATEGVSCLLQLREIVDWAAFTKKLAAAKKDDSPEKWMLQRFSPDVRKIVSRANNSYTPEEQGAIVRAVNEVLSTFPLLLVKEFHEFIMAKPLVAGRVMEYLPNNRRWTEFDFHRWNRGLNRLLLECFCPTLTQASHPAGPENILVYRARDELIGEIGLIENNPRSTTCVAYNHPENDPDREVSAVQMFRLSREVFSELLAAVPDLRPRIEAIVAKRHAETKQRLKQQRFGVNSSLLYSEQGEKLGLVQGQQLMLIDLDRCTRCDECVKACVDTHDDGRSRLFLNGPRVDKYLIPTTCRSCLDPACMIGCPVGSIHPGDNREIIIENWCIGCNHCADQCPYGAIQMHGISIVPEGQIDWRFLPGETVSGEDWTMPNHNARKWPTGRAPFCYDRLFRETLADLGQSKSKAEFATVCFRLEFTLTKSQLRADNDFSLTITSTDGNAKVWINGTPFTTTERPREKRDKDTGQVVRTRVYPLADLQGVVARGKNVLAVRVHANAGNHRDIFFDARLDAVRKMDVGNANVKPVTELAVVCDLCSALPTGPACVTACPHDAAVRVDALSQFH